MCMLRDYSEICKSNEVALKIGLDKRICVYGTIDAC